MTKLHLLAGIVPMLAFAACSGSDRKGGLSDIPVAPEAVSVTLARGAAIAKNLCASCHGADFAGGVAGETQCPSLIIVRNLTLGDFDAILSDGVDPAGQVVNDLMTVTRELSIEDRHAVHEYLRSWYQQ
jgi:mono/diheme cytochrome c family protein